MYEIPAGFTVKKEKILSALAVPDAEYTDLSPKGSVDEGIRDLINIINGMEGLVTTSSCAGRITVFLEGTKAEGNGAEHADDELQITQPSVPGGKGRGGRWLFVSHERIDFKSTLIEQPLSKLFSMGHQIDGRPPLDPKKTRYVRFQFEPMILHIMAASLQHAKPILSAAINAGFRETGLQSLKNLEDLNAFPMVAIRSSGLALGSLIGFANDIDGEGIQSLVDENYLNVLLDLANERFEANTQRINRLKSQMNPSSKENEIAWEDPFARKARKKAEGLQRRDRHRNEVAIENGIDNQET
ncbi:MAG: hypothetical protein MMC33_005800 [Icmadophila ericetorum]|nr:hypothetical protein [Icmadophila ericetorum]